MKREPRDVSRRRCSIHRFDIVVTCVFASYSRAAGVAPEAHLSASSCSIEGVQLLRHGSTSAQNLKHHGGDLIRELPDLLCLCRLRWNFVLQRPQYRMTRFAATRGACSFRKGRYSAARCPHWTWPRDRRWCRLPFATWSDQWRPGAGAHCRYARCLHSGRRIGPCRGTATCRCRSLPGEVIVGSYLVRDECPARGRHSRRSRADRCPPLRSHSSAGSDNGFGSGGEA